MVPPRGNKTASANRKRNSSGTTSAVPSKTSTTSPGKKTPIIILTNFADEELYKFEILFISYKVSRWQLNEAMLSALWVAQNQHQQAQKAYLTFMFKKQNCSDKTFVIFIIYLTKNKRSRVMTSLFAHKVAQPTKWRFLPKNLSQLVIFVIGLAFT